ncbi:hypothetical protein ACTXKQ_14485 [Corynebacterium variabile]|uniref:hypothetical protein n=1 Tax=Corynebacterium variabile TaxID=1727 RepID=UPI003F98ABBE
MSELQTVMMIVLWLVGMAGVLYCAYRSYVEAVSIERGSRVRQYSWVGGVGASMFFPGLFTLAAITDDSSKLFAVAMWTVAGAALAFTGFDRARRYRDIERKVAAEDLRRAGDERG